MAQQKESIQFLLDSAEMFQDNQPIDALDYAFKARVQSIIIEDELLLSQSYYHIGKTYRLLGDLKDAERFLNLAINCEIVDLALLSEFYNEKGIVLKQQSRFDEALVCYDSTLTIQVKLKNNKGIARTYNNIGRIYEAMENFDEATRYYQKALVIYDDYPIDKSKGITIHNIGNIHRAKGEVDSARYYYNIVLPIYQESGNKLLIAYVYNSLAAVAPNKELAIEYLNYSIELDKEINANVDLAKSYVELADVFIKDGEYNLAIPYLLNGVELFSQTKHKNSARDAVRILYKSYESIGDYKNALKYQSVFYQYQDSIKSESNSIAMLNYESELKLKDRENEIIINELDIKSKNEKLQLRKKQGLFYIIGISILAVLLGLVVLQVLRQKKNNRLLFEQKQIIEKSDKEKEVLIREIHHRVKNNLQIILSLLAIEQRKSDSTEVKAAMSYGKQRIEAMSLVHEKLYQQSDLTNIFLEDYLMDIAENLLFSFDKTNNIELDIQSDVTSINTDIAINLGLITSELMTNSIKHGFDPKIESFKISILISEAKKIVSYIYSDNGKGISSYVIPEKAKSFGYKLILSIIKKLKGQIMVNPKSNIGFELSFNFNRDENE